MKGSILVFLSVFSFFAASHAQLRIGIAGGIHQADVLEENNVPGFNDFKKGYSPRTGGHFGFVADLPFSSRSKLFFQPAVLFSNKGRKYADSLMSGSEMVFRNSTQYINYIDIPMHLVLKFKLGGKTKFMIGGGPYASFFYNGKESSQTYGSGGFYQEEENNDLPVGGNPGQYAVFNYGVSGLAGFEFGKIFLTANYSRGLNNFFRSADYEGSFKHQLIGGTLGIYLGKPVELTQKVKDRDNDGVFDDKDHCPDQAGPAVTNGCPDRDGDGIADKDDQCPDTPGTLANKGCPALSVDRDNDGVPDDKDKCPDVPGLARYDGCPIPDRDADGVNDEDDKCPDVVGYGRYDGCPIPDSDGDGINDEEDQCPTVKGVKENKGCPVGEIRKEIVEKVNFAARRIQFRFGKSELDPASFQVLDEVAEIMKQDPSLKIAVEGHTSSDGNFNANMRLSQARAERVKAYLISQGVAASRLSAKGFGQTRPLNNAKTDEEKAQNRRVELKLSN